MPVGRPPKKSRKFQDPRAFNLMKAGRLHFLFLDDYYRSLLRDFKFWESSADRSTSCVIVSKVPNKQGGYAVLGSGEGKITAHEFAYFMRKKHHYFERVSQLENSSEVLQVSHLCGQARCVNPNHLCLESAKVNNSRKGCLGLVTCLGCGTSMSACTHHPRCVTSAIASTDCSKCSSFE